MKRPPRISPRASRRRRQAMSSRHGGSQPASTRDSCQHTTPQRFSSVRATCSVTSSRLSAVTRRTPDQRPESAMPNSDTRRRPRASDATTPVRRQQQCAQSGEAVGVGQPQRHQFGQRLLDLHRQQSRRLREFIKEARAMAAQNGGHGGGPAAEPGRRRFDGQGAQNFMVAPGQQRDRCRAHRGHRAPGSAGLTGAPIRAQT